MSDTDSETEYNNDYVPVRDVPSKVSSKSHPIKLLTENDVIGYVQERFRLGEINEIYWSPLMLRIFKHYSFVAQWEYRIGLVELMLNVPLQLNVVFDSYTLDLNDTSVIIPYDGRLFIDSKLFVKKLLEDKFITLDDIRERSKYLFI